jgi:hypothetical protein
MSLSWIKPNASNECFVYADVANNIEWAGSEVSTALTFWLSIDDGSNWTNVTTLVTSINRTNQTGIFTPASSVLGGENYHVAKLKIIEDDSANATSAEFTLRKIPITSIKPAEDAEVHQDGMVNISWSELYTSGINHVKIELYTSSWQTIIASTPNTGSYVWRPADSQGATGNVKVRISAVTDTPDHTAMTVEGDVFVVLTSVADALPDQVDIAGDTIDYEYSPKDNYDIFPTAAQVLVEKATYPAAAIALAQLEGGHTDISLVQRNKLSQVNNANAISTRKNSQAYIVGEVMSLTIVSLGGVTYYFESVNGGTTAAAKPEDFEQLTVPTDYNKIIPDGSCQWRFIGGAKRLRRLANNIIPYVKNYSRKPREIQTILDFNATDSLICYWDDDYVLYFGRVRVIELTHGWGLGQIANQFFVSGQNPTSLTLEGSQIVSANDFSAPADDVKLFWEPVISDDNGNAYSNKIKIMCVIKDPAKIGGTVDSSYKFSVRIKELVPHNPTA